MSQKTIRAPEVRWLFVAVRLPAIIEADEAAALLGVPTHSLPILIAAKHVRPLGKPSIKASKKFSSYEILELSSDRKWQDQATRLIDSYWAAQNAKRSEKKGTALSVPL